MMSANAKGAKKGTPSPLLSLRAIKRGRRLSFLLGTLLHAETDPFEQFKDAVNAADKTLALQVARDGSRTFLAVKLDPKDKKEEKK